MSDQDQVNHVFNTMIKPEWDAMVAASGKSPTVFIATDKKATEFLANYQMAKECCESEGLVMPELVSGLQISLSSPDL